jgi:hypothetical protein
MFSNIKCHLQPYKILIPCGVNVAKIGSKNGQKILAEPLSIGRLQVNINMLYSQSKTKVLELMGGKALSNSRYDDLRNGISRNFPSSKGLDSHGSIGLPNQGQPGKLRRVIHTY